MLFKIVLIALFAAASEANVAKVSKASYLTITNLSPAAVTFTIVTNVDSFDWDSGDNRPDFNFVGVQIPANGGSVTQREELYYFASKSPFTMQLLFDDGTSNTFTVNQQYAVGSGDADFVSTGPHPMQITRKGTDTLIVYIMPGSTEDKVDDALEKQFV